EWSSNRPVLLILDEFDKVASGMSTNEQAFLRRLGQDYSHFGIVFVSCFSPSCVMEEVPEIGSRLLGVCTQERVRPLQFQDIKVLCRRIGDKLGCVRFEQHARCIWNAAGGFPVLVTSLAKDIAVKSYHAGGDLGTGRVRQVIDGAHDRLLDDIKSYC